MLLSQSQSTICSIKIQRDSIVTLEGNLTIWSITNSVFFSYARIIYCIACSLYSLLVYVLKIDIGRI